LYGVLSAFVKQTPDMVRVGGHRLALQLSRHMKLRAKAKARLLASSNRFGVRI
jgi:hypothetical protein